MTPEQFNICKDFHLELIRAKPESETINNARDFLVNGKSQGKASLRVKAENLADKISDRFDSLKAWQKTNCATKLMGIYNKQNTRNPSLSAFTATFQVMEGVGINQAAKNNGVNYQCIKVLKPRIERWDEYANKLAKTLN